MKLKYIFIIIGLLTLASCTSSKKLSNTESANSTVNYTSQFETDIKNYLDEFNQGNWENVLAYINPRLFTLAPKSAIISTFEEVIDMGMDMKTDFKEVKSISKIVSYQDTLYCQVFYKGDITIVINDELSPQAGLFEEEFKSSYGEKNVTYNSKKNTFLINAERAMMAASADDGKNWKYLEFNKKDIKLIKLLIPEKVIDQMKL